jgi:hypothetical protein
MNGCGVAGWSIAAQKRSSQADEPFAHHACFAGHGL